MTRARRSRIWTMGFWLLLATIFVHALLPVGPVLARTAGSAFSATTGDVSLAPSTRMFGEERGSPKFAGDGGVPDDFFLVPLSVRIRPPGAVARLFLSPPAAGTRSSSARPSPFRARAPPTA